jgi:hypothetical protein
MIIRYLSDPRIFSDNAVPYCQIFQSPSGNPFWNTAEILEGLAQKDVMFRVVDSEDGSSASTTQKLFGLVDYVNRIMLNILQSKGKFLEFTPDLLPGHISEGVIVGAHLADGSFAYMKVKDDLFADDEEQTMKLESL